MITPFIRPEYSENRKAWRSEQTAGIASFGGGMNNASADNVIGDNECSDCKNMMFLSQTHMQKRYGTYEYNPWDMGDLDEMVSYIDEYKPFVGSDVPIRCTPDHLYVADEIVCDVAEIIDGVNFNGKYYFVDGQKFRYWDGESVKEILPNPVAYTSHDMEIDFSGAVNYKKRFDIPVDNVPLQSQTGDKVFILSSILGIQVDVEGVYVGSTTDETGSVITVELEVPDLKKYAIREGSPIMLFMPLGETYVEGEKKMRAIDGQEYVWYEPCINDIIDNYQGIGYMIKTPRILTVHKNRLFIAGDDEQPYMVYMSGLTSPLWFPANSTISTKPDGQRIVDLVVFDGALIIGRNEDLAVLYGSSPHPDSSNPFYVKQMDVATGFKCKNCGALLNNYYIYLGNDGKFYKLNTPTTLVEYLMTRPLDNKMDIHLDPFNIGYTEKLTMSTVAFHNEIYFHLKYNLTLVYSYTNMAWTYYTGYYASCYFNNGEELLIGTHTGKILKYDYQGDTYSDSGRPIECRYSTKRYDFGSPISYKYFKSFIMTTHAWNDKLSSLNVKVEVDYADYYLNEPIESNTPRFGIAKWGQTFFHNRNVIKSLWYNLDIRGRTIKFIFSNNEVDEPVIIYDIYMLLTGRDVR